MDDVLAARNEQGHLTAPLLFLNREAVPEDAEDWDAVLVFSDGKTRATINSTVIILYKDNDFTQTLEIETGGAWSISGVDENRVFIDPDQMQGTGSVQISIHKAPEYDVSGLSSCAFTLSIDGAVVNEKVIRVYIFNGGGFGAPHSIILNEVNQYSEVLNIPVPAEYETDGVSVDYFTVAESTEGQGFVITAKSPPRDYVGFFTIFDPVEEITTFVRVAIDASVPLRVQYGHTTYTHGQTLTVTFTPNSAGNYFTHNLYITRDREWEIVDIDSAMLSVSPAAGNNSIWVTLEKEPELEVDTKIETQFRIVSQSQWVDVDVIFMPRISGQFIAPPDGIGAPGGTAPVYIYL
jgi:hypothetical protein